MSKANHFPGNIPDDSEDLKIMAIVVRKAESKEAREKVYRLRYEIYVEEMNRKQDFADNVGKKICDPFDETSHLLVAEDDGVPVGTIRINLRREGPMECEKLYGLEKFRPYFPESISMTTKLMVKASHRNSQVAGKLAIASYGLGRELGVVFDFIDCNPHLVRLYQQLGHRFYMPPVSHPEYGTVIPMVMVLEGVDYFNQVRSPMRREQSKHDNSPESSRFFENTFPEYASILPSFVLNETGLQELWGEQICENAEGKGSAFFQAFSEEEIQRLMRQFDPIDYSQGDDIIRFGEESSGMFYLLDGQVAVIVPTAEGGEITVDLLHAGEIFGEMGLVTKSKRNATIRVKEPSKVLMLNQAEFSKLEKVEPALALKLMTNLFTSVVQRFETQQAEVLRLKQEI